MVIMSSKIINYIIIQNRELSINELSSQPVIENVQLVLDFINILIGVAVPLLLEKCYSCSKNLFF